MLVQHKKAKEYSIKLATVEVMDVFHFQSSSFLSMYQLGRSLTFISVMYLSSAIKNVTMEYSCARKLRRLSGALLKLANLNLKLAIKGITPQKGQAVYLSVVYGALLRSGR